MSAECSILERPKNCSKLFKIVLNCYKPLNCSKFPKLGLILLVYGVGPVFLSVDWFTA